MERLVRQLCSPRCAGRAPGTTGGVEARGLVVDALRDAGLDPYEQAIGQSGAANVLATIRGDVDRWVLVAAHYDHLGGTPERSYPGADDNAAAVAILVEVARGLASQRADGRGVIIAAFDAEEPPYFLTREMGSAYFAAHAADSGIPLETIDTMVCMDLVGHALGPEGLPDPVRSSIFALGAERSEGTAGLVDELARTFIRVSCARTEPRIRFVQNARDDASSLRSFAEMLAPLASLSPLARDAEQRARDLLARCDATGRLPAALASAPSELALRIKSALA